MSYVGNQPAAPSIPNNFFPPGVVMDYGGATAPDGWLLCDGSAVSRTTYANLFAALGTSYGAGNGSTTFNLPDCRGRLRAGKDNMGGSAANRLTSTYFGTSASTLGAVGGSESHTLTTAQLAAHGHTFSGTSSGISADHTHTIGKSTGGFDNGMWHYDGNSTAGGDASYTASSTTSGASADHTHTYSGTTANGGSGNAHNNVQPTIIFNTIIKT